MLIISQPMTNDLVGWPKLTEGVTDEKNLKNDALGSWNRGEASINLQSSGDKI